MQVGKNGVDIADIPGNAKGKIARIGWHCFDQKTLIWGPGFFFFSFLFPIIQVLGGLVQSDLF